MQDDTAIIKFASFANIYVHTYVAMHDGTLYSQVLWGKPEMTSLPFTSNSHDVTYQHEFYNMSAML